MATLLLSAVGTAVGGPIGGAIGALAGRQIDARIFGSGRREGPRLKDLTVSSSSYGTPIARHFGQMRVPGIVIWSTDLAEQRETSGGGKSKPKTTTYSYSVSFAVALASRPIDRVGRIWADGNLLRGSAGDLKTGGTIRIYQGWGDQPLDPLLASAEGLECPAYRNIAYVVFEDLQLADFGNRIPALSFEIFSGSGTDTLAEIAETIAHAATLDNTDTSFLGYSWEGGTLGDVLASIDSVEPLIARSTDIQLRIASKCAAPNPVLMLPPPAIGWSDGDYGELTGFRRSRQIDDRIRPTAMRYYDVSRDYQPGTQRASGRMVSNSARTIEFPATLDAVSARQLIQRAALAHEEQRETLLWRTAEFDPELQLGSLVQAPGIGGMWLIEAIEWREGGIEYELRRTSDALVPPASADAGRAWSFPDLAVTLTLLRAFELPLQSTAEANITLTYAAPSSESAGWPGISLYGVQGAELIPLEVTSKTRAVSGRLLTSLEPSNALRLEHSVSVSVELNAPDWEISTTTVGNLAAGANRLLVGNEVIQFAMAAKISDTVWKLSGLLRGRGGTEGEAALGHGADTPVTLIDERLVPLARSSAGDRIAAIGPADSNPVYAEVENRGIALRPLSPVHPRRRDYSDGGIVFEWTRRARGAWLWTDEVDVPIVEESERYRVGIGPTEAPLAEWQLSRNKIAFDMQEWADLVTEYSGHRVWVRQIGDHAQSLPLMLDTIS